MKLLTLCGSNNADSINRKLLNWAADQLPASERDTIDLFDIDLPLYSQDWESDYGVPGPALSAFEKIRAADALIIACPEHNGSMPAVFKNLIDWLSRADGSNTSIFGGDKPVLLLSTSPGGNGGATNLATLEKLLPYWGCRVTGRYSLGSFFDNWQDNRPNTESQKAITSLINHLRETAVLHQNEYPAAV